MAIAQQPIDLKDSLLTKSTILYVEDDEILREEITSLLKDFFKDVIVASNGAQGLELYEKNQKKIKIILTDINMPVMNGIEFISKVRKIDYDLPILVCTAFNDADTLIKVIRLKIDDYIIKPMQLLTTLKICNRVLSNRNNQLVIEKQLKELEDIKMVLEEDNLIIETSPEGVITNVNPLISQVSGFEKDELIGNRNSVLKHPDTSSEFVKSLWSTISSGQKWHGKIKNITKDGETFYVKTSIIPIFDEDNNIIKYLSSGVLITQEEEERQLLRKMILKQKGERLQIENDMQEKINEEVQKILNNTENQKDMQNKKLISLVNEMDNEIKRLRTKSQDDSSRVLTSENRHKEIATRFDNMQIGYQKKVSNLSSTLKLLAEKCENLIGKNKLASEKLEKAQVSIKTLQGYIDDYRKKIEDLEDVIKSYEEDSQTKRYY